MQHTAGDRLTDAMLEKGVSVARLAELSGLAERTILDIMAGKTEPWPGCLCRLAHALGTCACEFHADDGSCAAFIRIDTLAKLETIGRPMSLGLDETLRVMIKAFEAGTVEI